MKKYLLILCCLLGMAPLFSQDSIPYFINAYKIQEEPAEKQASLSRIISHYLFTDLDSARIYKDELLNLAERQEFYRQKAYELASRYHYYNYEMDSALAYSQKSLGLAKELADPALLSDAHRKLAILYSRKQSFEEALRHGQLALRQALITDDPSLIGSAYTMLGNQHYKKNDYEQALAAYLKSDSIFEAHNIRDRNAALVYDNIGSIYSELKDPKALPYIEAAAAIYQETGDQEGLYYNHTLMGVYYHSINQPREAIQHFLKALDFFESYGNAFRQNEIYARLINLYSALEDYPNAEKYLSKSEALVRDSESSENLFDLYVNAGQLYLDQQKYRSAISYLSRADSVLLATQEGFVHSQIRQVKKNLAQAYSGLGDFRTAYAHKQKELATADSIYRKNNIETSRELEAKYQAEQQQQQIALLQSRSQLAEQRRLNQRNYMAGGILLTTLALVVLFVLYRNRQKTNDKLRQLDTLKTNFFTNISHEFRTPLSLIAAPLQEALNEKELNGSIRKNLELASKSTRRLTELTDQLLDLSKIDGGKLQLELKKGQATLHLAAWCEKFSFLAEKQGASLRCDIHDKHSEVWFDADALEKIFNNLLGNAVKYTPKGGEITVYAAIRKNKLLLDVQNSGSPLSPQQQQQIFQRFYQADQAADGVGIGLSLCRELVELHQGSIRVESRDNQTTFKVELEVGRPADFPITPSAETRPETTEPSPSPTEMPSNTELPILLIVEDNQDLRELLASHFQGEYKVLTAKDGEEGIKKAFKHIPDLVLSDVMMPGIDGMELTERLKSDERSSHIPILLLTAKAGDEYIHEGISLGADDYITKPYNPELLRTKVANLINIRRQLQQRYSQELILKPRDIAITPVDELFLEKVQKVLDDKLTVSSFSVEDFCKELQMSRMQLHRKLKALTGLSTSEFIRSQRLKLAATLLRQPETSISQVGYTVGFNDPSYFAKCFREAYHISPSEYAAGLTSTP